MTHPLSAIREAADAAERSWTPDGDAATLPDAALVAVNAALSGLLRHVDAARAKVAAEVARRSRAELGAGGLAKRHGFRSPAAFVAATSGGTVGEAARLISVGEGTAPRSSFDGDRPPLRPHVAAALGAGELTLAQANSIMRMLERVQLRADPTKLGEVEHLLCDAAPGLPLDRLMKLIARAQAELDPRGVEPTQQRLRDDRALHLFERDGMVHIIARLDPETAAPVKAAIEGYVTHEFRAAEERAGRTPIADAPRRTVSQMRADALALFATHTLGCRSSDVPLEGATVIVRVALADLEGGGGYGTIDGLALPVSIGTVRRMAASGGVIPVVLGGDSEILDWGRRKRFFTWPQRLALAERDGGCAMCGQDPGKTKAHHLRWWARDAGPTDLDNGVLLCESCHHRIHDNGWDIRIEGTGMTARVWFVPPPDVDPDRTPRLGGRARFDLVA